MNWVVIEKLSELSGLSKDAIRARQKRGIWKEGIHWRKTSGRLWFNLQEIEKWVEGKVQ